MMSKMREAIRWMSDQPKVKEQEIRDLLVREILAGNSMEHYSNDDVVKGLLRAYDAAVSQRLADDDKDVEPLPFEKVEILLNKQYHSGYEECTGFPAQEAGGWPDGLPCQPMYAGLVREIGYALGYMDGRRMLAMASYMEDETRKRARAQQAYNEAMEG